MSRAEFVAQCVCVLLGVLMLAAGTGSIVVRLWSPP